MSDRFKQLLIAGLLVLCVGGCADTAPGGTANPDQPAASASQETGSGAAKPSNEKAPTDKPGPCKSDKPHIAYNIESMQVDEMCYTVPWAMWLDTKGKFWLNPKYDVSPTSQGTSHMPVKRTAEGFEAWPGEDEVYAPTDKPGYVGQGDLKWIAVISTEGW